MTGASASERISAIGSPARRTRTRRSDGPPPPAPRAAPDVQLRGFLVRGEQDVVPDVQHRGDLESRWGDGFTVERDPAGVLRLVDEHEPAVAQPIWHPRHDRLPVLGRVLEERLCLPGVRVGLHHEPSLLVT
jgi:hypothetical protein